MPLTLEQKQSALQANGYDPSKYEVDDNGSVYEKPPTSIQPTLADSPVSPLSGDFKPPISPDRPLTTFAKSAATSVVPSLLAGIGAGALTSEVNPLAHLAPPYRE